MQRAVKVTRSSGSVVTWAQKVSSRQRKVSFIWSGDTAEGSVVFHAKDLLVCFAVTIGNTHGPLTAILPLRAQRNPSPF